MHLGALPLSQLEEQTTRVDPGPPLEAPPMLSVVESRQRKLDQALAAIHGFVIGDLPLDLYNPSDRNAVQEDSARAGRQSFIPLEMGPVELRRSIHEAGFRWSRTRWDSDTGTYPSGDRLSIEGRREQFLANIRDSLPFGNLIRGDLVQDVDQHMDAFHHYSPSDVGHKGSQHGFDSLLEDQMRISYLLPEDSGHGSLPFESFRDFVESILPTHIPMSRPTCRYKARSIQKPHTRVEAPREDPGLVLRLISRIRGFLQSFLSTPTPTSQPIPHIYSMGKVTREDPDLVLRLINGFGRHFSDLHGVLSTFEPLETFEDHSFHSFVSRNEWPDMVREIRSIRWRLDEAAPGSIVRIAHSEPEQKTLQTLNSIPPFDKAELEPWAQLNGLTEEELDVLYEYLIGIPTKKIPALEALMEKLFKMGGALHDPTVSFTCKPIVIAERGQKLDPWSKKLIDKIKSSDRDPDQALLLEADNHAHSVLTRIRSFSDRRADVALGSPDFHKWSEACEALAKRIDPKESYEAFQELIRDIWGDLESFRSYVSALVDAKKAKTIPAVGQDPRFIALLAIQRGWIDCMTRLLKQGRQEDSSVEVSVQTLSDLQRFLALHVGKKGFPLEHDYIKWLVYSNDPLLLALTEADYYEKDTHSLGLHLGRHMRAVGTESSHSLAEKVQANPVGLYASAKFAYLKGDYEACLLFVETVVRPTKDSSYFDDFLHDLRDSDDAKNSEVSELRNDKAGLRGYAPIRIREAMLLKELVRMGRLCISRLPQVEGEEAERRRALEEMLKGLQGELAPSHLMNLHLDEAEKARNTGDFERADYHIECAWKAIGDQTGYEARRIEHNTAENMDARLVQTEGLSSEEKHRQAGEILVIERNLHLEERHAEGGAQDPMRVWEYDASYLQALIRFAKHSVPTLNLPTVERRHKSPFAFEDFEQKSMTQWIMESSQLAQESLKELAKQSLKNAKWAGGQIIEWLKTNLPLVQDSEIQKLPLLAEWEALVNELK